MGNCDDSFIVELILYNFLDFLIRRKIDVRRCLIEDDDFNAVFFQQYPHEGKQLLLSGAES